MERVSLKKSHVAKQRSVSSWQIALKRPIDVVFATLALVILSPVLLVIVIAVKLTSPGPIFYQWNVIGRDGAPFTGYKFRTMVLDADARKSALLRHNERKGPTFKMRDDPRVTSVGRILRKFSLDELPQLWSVLKGDMSLIGPRPVGPIEWQHFEPWQRRKLSMTPGLVCLWPIWRTTKEFSEWIRLDLEYVDTWSIWLDVKIFFGAILFVLSGRNY